MRAWISILSLALGLGFVSEALSATVAAEPQSSSGQIEVSADKSLEWYKGRNMYVARGNAKAVRGDLSVSADLLTAHVREKAKGVKGVGSAESGDIERMTAEGNVVILKGAAKITGDRAVDDIDKHVMIVTGNNLRYEANGQIVAARDSLEYWDETKVAVARGNAVAVKGDRHVKADVLTAEFRSQPNGEDQLSKMTAVGNVMVITKNDVVRGDKGVYDAGRDIAIVSGNVRITRADGTELVGDVGESDFATNQSRLLNEGSGRVRALLPAKATSGKAKPALSQGGMQ